MHGFVIYYIEANIICVIVFGILLFYNHFNIDRQEKQVKYDRALIAFILYFLADSIWAAIVAEVLPKTLVSVVVDVFLIYLFMAAITYFWLEYVMAVEQVPHRERPINKFAVIFPFLVATAALIANYIAAPQTLINDQLDTLPRFSIYLATVPCIYLVAILFYSLRKAKGEENPDEKRKHLFIGFFPLLTMVGGLIQMALLPYIPIYCFICMILMLVFFIQSIERQISVDPLTSLNNRGQLMRYISQKTNLCPDDRLTFVIMMDINDFKAINDTYGHAEGDRALVLIAQSLKAVVNRHSIPSFLGRYGGDEFILIIHPVSRDETDQLVCEICRKIEQSCRVAETPYLLSISAGYDELTGVQDSFQRCVQHADENLYRDKEQKKRQRQSAVTG